MRRIPVAAPDLSGNEERYVADAVRSSWIASTGPYVERFEAEFADLCGTRTAVSVANGTVALHLALIAHGVTIGDEVVVPSLTYVATANAVRYTGATAVFVDVEPGTWCIDPEALEAAITPRTKGVIAVHLYGHPADMDRINEVAQRHGLWVIEDAAEAHGARYNDRATGSLASIGVFSFYGNKILTSGEGGALTLDDADLEALIRLYRGQGMDPSRRYFFPVIGYNYRLTNVACAILCAQLERATSIIERRRAIFARYRSLLQGIEGIGFQPVAPWANAAPWLFCITVDQSAFGQSRDALMSSLGRAGIETRPFFIPIHLLPPYVDETRPVGAYPVTLHLADTGLNLPTFAALTDDEMVFIANAIREAGETSP